MVVFIMKALILTLSVFGFISCGMPGDPDTPDFRSRNDGKAKTLVNAKSSNPSDECKKLSSDPKKQKICLQEKIHQDKLSPHE